MGLRVLLAGVWPLLAAPIENPEEFPNLLAGTLADSPQFSTGNTLPLVGRPWGFNHFCPQTNDGKSTWWFAGESYTFHWLRLTHQPSPWIGDWAWVLFGPQMGARVEEPVMFFNPWGAHMKPHVFDATLGPDNMRVQLTPSDHGAVLKVTFPAHNPQKHPKRICFKVPAGERGKPGGSMGASDDNAMFMELTSLRQNDAPSNFALHLRAQVDTKSLKFVEQVPASNRASRSKDMHCFEFSPDETEVTVWMATSLISAEMAELSLRREVLGRPFESVEEESRSIWRELLGRVDVVDPGPISAETSRRLIIFYTSLWRALTFPRRIDEIDPKGKRIHYSPYDKAGGTYDGVLVTDNGFWDVFRTVYPLLSLVYPAELGEILTGWLNAYKEGGWLPEWSSPGYRVCMVGTFADVVIADAILKDVEGFDKNLAWEAIRKDSFEEGGRKGQGGKLNLKAYTEFGYIPNDLPDSVSGTLDFAFSDYAVSMAAEKLQKPDTEVLRSRAIRAREHLFDRTLGLMRPKGRGGYFSMGQPTQWGGGFTEGASWHHSFPPFDLMGLVKLHGSRDKLGMRMQELWQTPGNFEAGTYKQTIHEMEEMRTLGMGQYAHNNQPVHHLLHLMPGLDTRQAKCTEAAKQGLGEVDGTFCPRLFSEKKVHEVLERAYGIEWYAGDEDNGEMSAWYVLAALGLYEPAPGTKHGYALGSPLFRRVDLHRTKRGTGPPTVSIVSHRSGRREVQHVTRVLLDDKDVGLAADDNAAWTLSYEDLFQHSSPGATLRFMTGSEGLDEAAPGMVLAGAPPHEPYGYKAPERALPPQENYGSSGASSGGPGVDNGEVQRLQQQLRAQQDQQMQEQQKEHQLEEQLQQQQAAVRYQQALVVMEKKKEATMAVEEQKAQSQISQLEKQLKQRSEMQKSSVAKTDFEVDVGLTNTMVICFCLLVAANGIGWWMCMNNSAAKKNIKTRPVERSADRKPIRSTKDIKSAGRSKRNQGGWEEHDV